MQTNIKNKIKSHLRLFVVRCRLSCALHNVPSIRFLPLLQSKSPIVKLIKYFYSIQLFIPPRQMDAMIINTWFLVFETLVLFFCDTSSVLVLICAFNLLMSKCEIKFVKQRNKTCET